MLYPQSDIFLVFLPWAHRLHPLATFLVPCEGQPNPRAVLRPNLYTPRRLFHHPHPPAAVALCRRLLRGERRAPSFHSREISRDDDRASERETGLVRRERRLSLVPSPNTASRDSSKVFSRSLEKGATREDNHTGREPLEKRSTRGERISLPRREPHSRGEALGKREASRSPASFSLSRARALYSSRSTSSVKCIPSSASRRSAGA